ncbi:hypothetical protein IQ249_13040 [Lusitaniella coriacea LEGE 07157]|uniref:Uncharacterized protein n=1 Tax=Lusitaniella coriacea LEGE 07157 TaxID=945747 RepID=A0A8J7DX28_9CYAN|nr:hypothetical protein [Lusitaniella coriacea]MBE9116826.1 hypothetical protein [Lusitaniella coriacea LEGE 07157]
MAGNELEVCKFILSNKTFLKLRHLGKINKISAPIKGVSELYVIKTEDDLSKISTESSRKKADIYLNKSGISIKQLGGSFSFNRLQRANIIQVHKQLQLTNIDRKLSLLEEDVNKFHQGQLTSRNVPWLSFWSEQEFKKVLEFLMMKRSPNLSISKHQAEYILEAPQKNISQNNVNLYTFDEYFDLYKDKLSIAIRRQWVGQRSNSEHKRALSLGKKPANFPWIFNEVVGEPTSGWRDDFPANDRRTVYFLMIEKKK